MKTRFIYALAALVVAIGMASCEGGGGGKVHNVKFRRMNLNGVNTLALASRGAKANANSPARLRAAGEDELVEAGMAVERIITILLLGVRVDCGGLSATAA